MIIIKFLSQANSELIDAVSSYEGELSSLGHASGTKCMGLSTSNRKIFPYYISYLVRVSRSSRARSACVRRREKGRT